MKLDKAGPVTKKALSTPAVRHMAKKNKLDINQITGSGKGGRVTKEDVINFMSGTTPASN
jgi:pyruvate/2-oxoglutarate dehydrogenase complex dihydrolipoamide acyltransferase (E2) component